MPQRRYIKPNLVDQPSSQSSSDALRCCACSSGAWLQDGMLKRSVPVNVLELDAERYLVAPRGETDWVHNVRAVDGQLRTVGTLNRSWRSR